MPRTSLNLAVTPPCPLTLRRPVAVASTLLVVTSAGSAADATAAPAKKATPGRKEKAAGGGSAKKATMETLKESVSGPEVREFRAFCDEWMQ